MAKAKDITGRRFHRLVVIARAGYNKWGAATWLCQCDCGETTTAITKSLNRGSTKSCGCLKKDNPPPVITTHGMARSPEYQAWGNMLSRCHNKSYRDWHNYGGRGIGVCERWKSFPNFHADMGVRPSPSHSLDRIDSNGNYEPGNCRWANVEQQHNNQRRNRVVEAFGKKLTVGQWSKKTGIHRSVIGARLKIGWSPERALTASVRRGSSKSRRESPPESDR